ncbi:hypothetical protein TKK_0017024 [Trichogramma kaykai]
MLLLSLTACQLTCMYRSLPTTRPSTPPPTTLNARYLVRQPSSHIADNVQVFCSLNHRLRKLYSLPYHSSLKTKIRKNTVCGSETRTSIVQFFNFLQDHNPNSSNRLFSHCINSILTSNFSIQASNFFNLYSFNYHDQVHSIPFDISLGREVSDCDNPNLVIDSFISNNNLTDIYNDGSKVSGGPSVGSAFCCLATGRECAASYDPLTSIFSAECHAINAALDYIHSEAVGRNYIILSGSLSALQSLQSANLGVKSNHALFEIKSKFIAWHKNNRGFSMRLAWIPSHIGICGNERADALARAATEIDPGAYPQVAFSDLVALFKRTAAENTTAASLREAKVKGVRFFASFHNSSRTTSWFRDKALDRFHIVTVNRMRSDHHNLAESLHRKNIVTDPGCRPLNIESIIAAPNIQACVAVCEFLRRCSLRV